MKAGVRAVSSNAVAGQAKPETVSATPVKAWGSNNPKGRVPRALPVGEWELARRASSIACVLERVPRALPVGIYRTESGLIQGIGKEEKLDE